MKRLFIASLIVMAVMVLAPLSGVIATDQTPPLTVSESGAVWTVDLLHPIDQGFSGKIVADVEIFWGRMETNPNYDPNGPEDPINNPPEIPVYYLMGWTKLSVTDVQVKIWIDPLTLPEDDDGADRTMVKLYDADSGLLDSFADGPAPAYRWY